MLLVVHGGPGEAQWPYAGHYRGLGKAFHRGPLGTNRGRADHSYGRYGSQGRT